MSFDRTVKMAPLILSADFGRKTHVAVWRRVDMIDGHFVRRLRAIDQDDGVVASNG